jgi:hypothetical protein
MGRMKEVWQDQQENLPDIDELDDETLKKIYRDLAVTSEPRWKDWAAGVIAVLCLAAFIFLAGARLSIYYHTGQ